MPIRIEKVMILNVGRRIYQFLKSVLSSLLLFFCSISAFSQTDSIDVFIQGQMQKRRIPGLELAIVRNGKIVKTGFYGLANIQDSIPVSSKSVFTINSITKAFVGVAILQLAEEGKLKLNDRLFSLITNCLNNN
ncbi:serine hydrolase domain-containing protein [Chryseobacterium sp. 8AT]|uniref:serine hydrolase domain-containing protein n=1 Tax=Chryseobacterium sp. 8AT TaxID=2653134 RepID=UPI0012F0663C